MKKLFLFAATAVTLAAGCQKLQELVKPGNQPVDDNSPVEIQFTTNVATVESKARTKALGSVDAFDATKHTLYIYGLNMTSGEKQIINEAATVSATSTPVQITWKESKTFFYNGTKDVYEFFGYYIDDAKVSGAPLDENGNNLTVDLTINGQQDILLAKANPATDRTATGVDQSVVTNTDYVYSAWSARNGVKPNLKFDHALTKFTFQAKNLGTKDVTLKGVSIETAEKCELTVAGANQGITVDTQSSAELKLPLDTDLPLNAQGTFTDVSATNSIMAFPEQEYKVILYLTQDGIQSGQVRKVTVPVTIDNKTSEPNNDKAWAGYAYKLQILVYSLEQVEITASLTPWEPGANQELDSENAEDKEEVYPPQTDDKLYAELTGNTATTLTYSINIPEATETSRYSAIQVAVSKDKVAPTTGWQDLTFTKASQKQSMTFTVAEPGKYYCHMQYKKEAKLADADWNTATEDADYTPVIATDEVAGSTFSLTYKGIAKDETTYTSLLPTWYQAQYGDYEDYKNSNAEHELPWFVFYCSPSPALEITVKNDTQTYTITGWKSSRGLITIAGSELGADVTIAAGTYEFTINGVTATVEVKAEDLL